MSPEFEHSPMLFVGERIMQQVGRHWFSILVAGFVGLLLSPVGVAIGDCDSHWVSLAEDPDDYADVTVVHNDGSGESLFVGGKFLSIGSTIAAHIARWDGEQWWPLGEGLNGRVYAIAVHEDEHGTSLYVGGEFTQAGGVVANHIARWDGSSWSAVGAGVSGPVHAIYSHEDDNGPLLLVSGNFTQAGNQPALRLASWNGSAWAAFGPGMNATANVFAMFDDGNGEALYIAGDFTQFGGQSANRIVRWSGGSWQTLNGPSGNGLNSRVEGLVVHDDGSGTALYVGGQFTLAGGTPASRIAKWDGSEWSPVGTGTGSRVRTMTLFDDGSGAAIYIGGHFTGNGAGSIWLPHVAKWDGSDWAALDTGVNSTVLCLTGWQLNDRPALYASGWFTQAGGEPARHLAAWSVCAGDGTPCPADLNGDGFVNLPDLNLVLSNFGQT
ncbi:MAG: hypothetical protein ACNA8P_10550, partial [Phycisphaerales bacterium]